MYDYCMYSKFLLSIVFIFYVSSSFAFELDVEIDDDKVTGKIIYEGSNRNVIGWLGIPYAEPPIGDLRWRAPRDFKGFSGNFMADKLPNRCTQISNSYDTIIDNINAGDIIGTEDCLYLNVYRPDNVDYSAEKLHLKITCYVLDSRWR